MAIFASGGYPCSNSYNSLFHHSPILRHGFLECLMIVLSNNNYQTPGHFKQINTPRLSDYQYSCQTPAEPDSVKAGPTKVEPGHDRQASRGHRSGSGSTQRRGHSNISVDCEQLVAWGGGGSTCETQAETDSPVYQSGAGVGSGAATADRGRSSESLNVGTGRSGDTGPRTGANEARGSGNGSRSGPRVKEEASAEASACDVTVAVVHAAFRAGGAWSGVRCVGPRGVGAGQIGDGVDTALDSRPL